MTSDAPRATATNHSPDWRLALRALREARGITQDGWAGRLGVSRRTVQRWERGALVPDAAMEAAIVALCEERGIFRLLERGAFAGFDLTPESLAALLATARVEGEGQPPAGPDRPTIAAPSPADDRPHSNLPAALSSFIGRERELSEAARLLGHTRLLTLTGTGGVGKTRLALEVGGAALDRYPDGVWLVELGPLTDAALAPQAVAAAVGVREAAGKPPVAALVDALAAKRLLLVLDNCEHLVAGCAALAERLLQACPGLAILATSREALGVAGETVLRVPSMAVPSSEFRVPSRSGHNPEPGTRNSELPDAVRLFVERTRAGQPDFALTDDNAPAVAQICRRLDGIPLALELAAARVYLLGVRQVAARLDDRFRLLTGGSRTAPPRHQTLRATLDWSHELLTEPERTLLRELSVFAGGWTLAAAETVCDPQDAVLELLASLVDKSLVMVDDVDSEARYRLLETVRQYARERVPATEADTIRRRHRDWFLALVERAEPELVGPAQGAWLARLEREHDNVRAALGWSAECGEAEAQLRLTGALWRFWEVRGHLTEGRRWLEGALVGSDGAQASLRARALTGAGLLARLQHDHARALDHYREALALFREVGDQQGAATTLIHLGVLAQNQGDAEAAVRSYEEGLALCRALGDRRRSAIALTNLGAVAHNQGDFERAAARQEEALALFRAIGDQGGVALALGGLGTVAVERGQCAQAAALFEEVLAIFRALGDQRRSAVALINLGDVAEAQADHDRALAWYAEALRLHEALGHEEGVAYCLEGIAAAVGGQGDRRQAARFFGAAAALREAVGAPRPPSERARLDDDVGRVRADLADDDFEAMWTAGRAAPLEEVIDAALQAARPR